HPLLASLGKQGRDFFDLIAGDTELDPHPLYSDTPGDSLLCRLQRDMLTLANPTSPDYALQLPADGDVSIELHATHGAMRELEVLKDRLLARFAADSSLTPADIVVLTPDINAYAPFIDSVFGKRSDAGAANIPYTIADRTVQREQSLLASFAALLDLLDSRFAADDVLSLLDCDALLLRFGLSPADVPFIHDWVRRSGIRWGRDAAHKVALGLPGDARHSWRWGLDRLLLGGILPDAMAGDMRSPLFGGLLPAGGASGSLAETLARFAALLETLFELADVWQVAAPPADWAGRVSRAAAALFTVDESGEDALSVLFDAGAELAQDAALAGYGGEVGLAVVRDYLKRRLKQSSGSGFLAGRVTFCAMVPMRSIPFRLLCLIGMNDGAYPRDERPVSFDLIARHPQKGDRSRRFDDRYLFLEAILSAREALYLSWVGRSARSDEPLPPSALVSELIDCLTAMAGEDMGRHLVCTHPLQPFSSDNYRAGRASFEPAFFAALTAERRVAPPFAASPLPLDTPRVVALSALIRFWQNPVRSFLGDQLGIRLAASSEDMATREPFALDRNSSVAVRTPLVAALYAGKPLAPVKARLSGMGLLPPAALGEAWLADELGQSARFAARLPEELAEATLPPEPLSLAIGDFTLAGELAGLRAGGLMSALPRRAHGGERIAFWLRHLVLCALRPKGVMPASLLVDDAESLHLLPVDDALEQLESWLVFYALGQASPLPFFPRTSLAAAKVLADDAMAREAALAKAYAEWDPSFTGRGKFPQKSEAAIELVFRGSDPLQDPQFLQLAEVLLCPMLAALDGIEPEGDA
ncbi:exodeoxyribonuclease V subunit gamma, partial [Craterilacuibacter sp.]|uniref:exodeoxyribonuclease V subunit gamma n=1 Tax=Craterilacuibacter sp. TaxID=2870909 RepID=UPI003F3907D2